jgi:glycosyltransferase involved in cell wall biosynthesis
MQEILPAGLRSFALGREWPSMRRYERTLVRDFDATIAVSEVDRDALVGPEDRESVSVIPIALDPAAYPDTGGNAGDRILHLGTMYWPPNVDAVHWFATEVLPLVRKRLPGVGFDVVGTRPPREIARLAANDAAIDVPGFVEQLAPWIERAGVFVVPLRAGSGMRVKILEAMARGLAVVTTRIGCEGIEVEHEREVLIADEPAAFAEATVRVLEDRRLASQLAENGRRLVRQRYDARRVYGAVTELYAELAEKKARSRRRR